MNVSVRQQELDIEKETYEEATLRRDADNRKTNKRDAWSESKLGISYVRSAASEFAQPVRSFMYQVPVKGRRFNRAAELLSASGLKPEAVAFLFTKAVFNLVAITHKRRLKRVSLCLKAAELIHDEFRIMHFAQSKNRKALLKKLFEQFNKRSYPRHWRRRTIVNYFHAEQLEWQGWTTKEKLHIGYALMVLFRDHTGLIEAPSNSIYVDPAPGLIDSVQDALEKRVLDYMIYKPMVVKPKPWTEDFLFRGGYLSSKHIRSYPIIKGSRKRDVQRMVTMDWSKVLPALNAIQETAWRVNTRMLGLLDWAMFDRRGGIAGLPVADKIPLPEEPEGYRTDEAIRKEHDRKCFLIHSENRELISKRLQVLNTILLGRKFKNFNEVYFPHNLDSRGRAYPLPAFLHPQGPDYVKAMLEFSRGLPIENDEQAAWLAIAGANAYGNDKVSLQERVEWVEQNHDMILSVAADPKSDLSWTQASEPFQFVRFCLEWAGFFEHGFGYVSHMVCPVDATCSGLQHYSAMLRDEVGGRSVNLIPGLVRQDVYQDVADLVIEDLITDGSAIAKDWLTFGIDRKTTKRQVMVVPYAGTFSSCMDYTKAAVAEKLKEGHACPWDTSDEKDHRDRLTFLSKLIWSAIDRIVVKGKLAMRWLSTAARSYAKWANKQEGDVYAKRMTWVTPDGFEVSHFRADSRQRKIDTYLDGYIQLYFYEDMDRLSPADMALAVAPNFVHSLDANLLRASVLRGVQRANPITDYGMVHDSFGVHAHNMPVFLSRCVKPAFIDMYEDHDVLQHFADRLPPEVLAKLDPLPAKGTLDLSGIQESEFVFS